MGFDIIGDNSLVGFDICWRPLENWIKRTSVLINVMKHGQGLNIWAGRQKLFYFIN